MSPSAAWSARETRPGRAAAGQALSAGDAARIAVSAPGWISQVGLSLTTALEHSARPGARPRRQGLPVAALVTARAAAAAWDPDAGRRGGDAPGDPGPAGELLRLPGAAGQFMGSSKTPKAAPSSGELSGPPQGAMGVSCVIRESAESAETAEMVAERSTAPAVARMATGSGVPSSAARAHTRRSSGEHESGRSLPSSATPATSQSAESSGDDVDLTTSLPPSLELAPTSTVGACNECAAGPGPVSTPTATLFGSEATLRSVLRTHERARRGRGAAAQFAMRPGGSCASAADAAAHLSWARSPPRRGAEHLRFVSVW